VTHLRKMMLEELERRNYTDATICHNQHQASCTTGAVLQCRTSLPGSTGP
jgi:hypothetical protein